VDFWRAKKSRVRGNATVSIDEIGSEENGPASSRKRDLVANCVILNNTVEMSTVLTALAKEGYVMTKDELAALV
jgi:hypothetical protein